MSETGTLLIRADASTTIGTGHVMRCLALAQALRDRGDAAVFLATEMIPLLAERLKREGCHVRMLNADTGSDADAMGTVAVAKECEARWIAVDGYHFGAEYYEHVKESGCRVIVIDDYAHATRYPVDVLLNQNLYAEETMYPLRDPTTQLLLGPRFALLRREFANSAGWERTIPPLARRILVTLGGTDPAGATLTVLHALNHLSMDGLEVTVVVGGGNPHRKAIQALAGTMRMKAQVLVQPNDMAALFREADIAVAAGGSSCYELAATGLPALLLTLAENQRRVVAGFEEAGVSLSLGWHLEATIERIATALSGLLNDPVRRTAMARQGGALCDGQGARRVIAALRGEASGV